MGLDEVTNSESGWDWIKLKFRDGMALDEFTICRIGMGLDDFTISGSGWDWMKSHFHDREGIE